MFEKIQGYKTKTVAVVAIIWALVGLFLKTLDATTAGEIILGGMGLFSLRDSIK